jgi:aspartyl-tRNA(Asn)/glutamyl-tRNA(Gln) amidotransferase subunit C
MKLSREQVQKLSHLARLEFSESELDGMMLDLDKMLAFVDRINQLDLEGVEPLIYMNNEVDKLRPDKSKSSVTREEALKNAPDRDTDYFRVPRVLKDEE